MTHEAAVLDEARVAEQKVIAEQGPCAHKTQRVVAHYGGMMEDPETYTLCGCGAGFLTVYRLSSKTYETRPMSKSELQRYARTQR